MSFLTQGVLGVTVISKTGGGGCVLVVAQNASQSEESIFKMDQSEQGVLGMWCFGNVMFWECGVLGM